MAEREAISVNLGDGFLLIAAGLRRERNGDLGADLMLQNGRVLFGARCALNDDESVALWADKATAPDRPTGERMAEAVTTYLLPDALGALQDAPQRGPTQADQIVGLILGETGDLAADVAANVELFHDDDGEAFATFPIGDHQETHRLRSRGFREWLARRFFEQHGKAPNAQALVDATNVLSGKARFEGPHYPVHTRVATRDGVLYLDLGDDAWRVIAVDQHGWRLLDEAPVKFRRTRGMLPLPVPAEGGSLAALCPFVNVRGDADWILILAWLLGAFRPTGPYPVLVVHGEQGSAKSTLIRVLRALIDPNTSPLRSQPRDERDLAIAGHNAWCLAYDNISHISDWLSDAYCRIATGGGFATRTLYEDDEETIFNSQRPIALNGIEEIATRNDLLDRAIIIDLPTIPEEERQPERVFWATFERARPAILGALLDAVVAALRDEGTVQLARLPRMADFATWVAAAEPALGWEPGTFLTTYTANRADANDLTLDASPVSQVVRDWVAMLDAPWDGTASELLTLLDSLVDEKMKKLKVWPGTARVLANTLRRLAPNLRAAGVDLEFIRTKRKRTIRIERKGHPASSPSPASPRPRNTHDGVAGGDDAGDPGDAGPTLHRHQDSARTLDASGVFDGSDGDDGDDGDFPLCSDGSVTEAWDVWEEPL